MMTRQEFEDHRRQKAKEMAADAELHGKVLDVLSHSDLYDWYQQPTWMGEPSLQFPQDLFAIQELIFKLRPNFVIELGVAWGGSLLFYASMMELVGHGEVIGIDLYVPEDLRERLAYKDFNRIALYEGSSTDPKMVSFISNQLRWNTRNIVILDSAHDYRHVLTELNMYSSFVGSGYYIICGDAIIDQMPPQHRARPWGPGNSPKQAIDEFLSTHPNFAPDKEIEDKLLFTCNPGGYLRNVAL